MISSIIPSSPLSRCAIFRRLEGPRPPFFGEAGPDGGIFPEKPLK
jgi:hypothetical protein